MTGALGNSGTGTGGGGPLCRRVSVAIALALTWATAAPISVAGAGDGDGILVYERAGGDAREKRILDYWTPERMHRAEPLDVVIEPGAPVPEGGDADAVSPSYVPPAPPGQPASGERKGKVPAGGRRPEYLSGAVPDPTTFPNTTNGKVYGRLKGFGGYECSGTVVDSPNMSVIFTAGHCVAERGRLASRLIFIPSYDRNDEPFGRWVFDTILVTKEWAQRGNFNWDMAAVLMSPQTGSGLLVQEAVGARGIAFGQARDQEYAAFGYPANKVNGQVMWSCDSRFFQTDPRPIGGGPIPFGIGCDMGAGASGGGWMIGSGVLNSLSSFGYGARSDVLYGPYFGGKARSIYRSATSLPAP